MDGVGVDFGNRARSIGPITFRSQTMVKDSQNLTRPLVAWNALWGGRVPLWCHIVARSDVGSTDGTIVRHARWPDYNHRGSGQQRSHAKGVCCVAALRTMLSRTRVWVHVTDNNPKQRKGLSVVP